MKMREVSLLPVARGVGLCAIVLAAVGGMATRAHSGPGDAAVEVALRAQVLAHENRILRERVSELESSAARATELERQASRVPELEQLVVRLKAAQPDAEARRVAMAAVLRDFFETASLVDQTLAIKQLPEGGYLQMQLKLMRNIRDYLRNEGRIGDVAIRDVDRTIAPRELVQVFLPQNALYLNGFALQRLREASDSGAFPLTLRYLLRSHLLIHEFDVQADPTGAIKAARDFQRQMQAEEARARGLSQGMGRGVMQAAPVAPPAESTAPGGFGGP